MPLEPGSPESWLSYARSDLAVARVPASDQLMKEMLCFHAQQAVEKSIKAVLILAGAPFPKVHSIERLIDLLPDSVMRTPELIESARLTAYATTFRYPGNEEPTTEEEHQEALRLAAAVLAWAEELVEAKGNAD
jgi:HEPN domain-containing protein